MIKGKLKSQGIIETLRVIDKINSDKKLERGVTERNVQVKPESGIDIRKYESPKGIQPEKELIKEMKEALEWYMDNTTIMNPGISYHETFFNLGMNLIVRAEEIINK